MTAAATADERTGTPGGAVLRALWHPGIGLSLWRSHEPADADPPPLTAAEVPAGTAEILADRAFRRTLPVIGPDGRRVLRRSVVLGRTSTLALLTRLDESAPAGVGGELRYYRHLLAGIAAACDAGAVAPAVAAVDGEHLLRWQLVAAEYGSTWRSWLAAVLDRTPEAVARNDPRPGGRNSAVADFVAEMTDALCRDRLDRGGAGTLLPDLVDDPRPLPGERGPAALTAWREWSVSAASGEPVVVFRLHLPEEPDPDQPARAVTAEPPWRLQVCRRDATGAIAAVVPQRLGGTELDEVAASLADALAAHPGLRAVGTDVHSLDYLLSTVEAEAFLMSGAASLRDAGFTVLLPRSIATVRPTLHAHARPVATNTGRAAIVSADDLAEFEWRLALGDAPGAPQLTQGDLDSLARQQGDLVRLRGVWVLAENSALSRAARFILERRDADHTDPAVAMRELLALIAGVADEPTPVPVTAAPGLGWLDDMAAGRVPHPPGIGAPTRLAATLRPYQRRGLDWLVQLSAQRIGGVLADDMGLGKTVQVIALLCHERENSPTRPTLVVCPMSLVGNWARELDRFAPHLRVLVHHGPDRLRGDDFHREAQAADVVLTTFAIATRDRALLARVAGKPWRRLVVDEAQHVKNVATAAASALRAIDARHRLALTGTPVENRLEDLRAVVDLVNPGMLGSPSTFKARFAEPIERERDQGTAARLRAITRPFILRRTKTDPDIVDGLPAKTELVVRANLTVEQAALYRAIVDELMAALADKQQRTLRRRTVLAALTRLKQVCNHPAHYLADGSSILDKSAHRSGKVELLADLASTAADEGDRMLVFTQFAEFAHLLRPWLSTLLDAPVPVLHGGLPRAERDRLVADFQDGGGPPLMLATLKAGGTGLNLTAANQVVHVDRWWNPAVEDQATDRAYRIGQEQHVQVRKFVCVGTLEERIDEMIAAKRELSALTVRAGESWLADLADEAVFDLLALRDEAVSE
ncbi:DEAD/DEAH box helicase [Gordonia sp. X0973]|uniref:DEAD/DEAH box helicase n=1 Tax=Gordonia sp. X0973 TaxID=2742602 RepID=UPI000F543E18|nr:DEAD/DEAH box helicase [Gordonia sp. X0973]QKT07835.1 DEAD/DEAH box helicase [Gordonia sp. X0973]